MHSSRVAFLKETDQTVLEFSRLVQLLVGVERYVACLSIEMVSSEHSLKHSTDLHCVSIVVFMNSLLANPVLTNQGNFSLNSIE